MQSPQWPEEGARLLEAGFFHWHRRAVSLSPCYCALLSQAPTPGAAPGCQGRRPVYLWRSPGTPNNLLTTWRPGGVPVKCKDLLRYFQHSSAWRTTCTQDKHPLIWKEVSLGPWENCLRRLVPSGAMTFAWLLLAESQVILHVKTRSFQVQVPGVL